ncbi:MAG: hypothetical protein Q9191_005536 [Dirinaria sp. TL-2023a]
MSSQKPQFHPLPPKPQPQHGHHPSASDSEPPPPAPPPQRSNLELNLSVLQRHFPSTSSLLALAPYAVLYIFNPTNSAWEKSGIEGTLFVCSLSLPPSTNTGQERYAVTILNRRGLENFWLELLNGEEVEKTSEYVILQKEDARGDGRQKVYGLWIFEEETGSTKGIREITADLITECAARAGATSTNSRKAPEPDMKTQMGPQYGTLEQDFDQASRELRQLQKQHEIHRQAYQNPQPPQHHPQPQTVSPPTSTKSVLDVKPNPPAPPPPLSQNPTPLFQTSADTQFFLSAPRIPKQTQPPQKPPPPQPDDELGRLFQKAKNELASQM